MRWSDVCHAAPVSDAGDTAIPAPSPRDEGRHAPAGEDLWGESWYFDFAAPDASVGGYVRLGLYPNLGVAWYWGCLVEEGAPLVTVIDHEVPLPASGSSLEIRTSGLWADHTCEEPLDHWSLGLEAFGLAIENPADILHEARGDLVPLGFELDWDTDGGGYEYVVTPRYEIPCRVHGIVRRGDQDIEIDAVGQRDHSWGVRDWWQFDWVWVALHLDDGTHLFLNEVRLPGLTWHTGYVQDPSRGASLFDEAEVVERPSDDGLVAGLDLRFAGLSARVVPVAWAPLPLVAPDGRRSDMLRALSRVELDDGRSGVGWIELNRVHGLTDHS